MDVVKILIVEDELLIAIEIQNLLERRGYVITGIVDTEERAIQEVLREKPDLVLMDIQLTKKTEGISAARKIKEIFSIPIMFITQLSDEKVFREAKETLPVSYITKPYNDRDLLYAVELAIQNSSNWIKNRKVRIVEQIKDGIFLIPTGGNVKVKLFYKDILFLKAAKAWTEIYYESNNVIVSTPYQVSLSSNHVFEQIVLRSLIKVHRSYFVNIEKIERFDNSHVYIQGRKIPVSNAFRQVVKSAFKSVEHNLFKK